MSARDVAFTTIVVACLALAFLVLHYSMNTMTDKILDNQIINQSKPAVSAFSTIYTTVDRLDYFLFAIFIGFTLAMIITGFLIGGNPIFMAIYFISNMVIVAISTIISNVWEMFATNPTFVLTATKFPLTNHLLTHLPIYATVIAFIGITVMFAKPYFTSGGQ